MARAKKPAMDSEKPGNVVAPSGNVECSTKIPTGTIGTTAKLKKGTIVGQEWQAIKMFLDNKSFQEIAMELGVSEAVVSRHLNAVNKNLSQQLEMRKLLESQAMDMAGKKYSWAPTKALDSQANRKFVQLLSEPDSPILTEEEHNFCYLLVYEGDAKAALVDAGLDVGIAKTKDKVTEYNRLLELRVTYLKTKPNLRERMKELQTQYVENLRVSKETIQAEIMRTITHLRNQNDPKNAPTIAKLISDLGRTEGVFVDKTEVDNRFSIDDSFEIMMQRRQALIDSGEGVTDLELTASGAYVDPSVYEPEEEESGYVEPDEQ